MRRLTHIVLEALATVPETFPTLTLAKKLAALHPEIGDVEHFRTSIRYYRGNSGDYRRDVCKNKQFMRENRTPLQAFEEFDIKAKQVGYDDFIIENDKILLLSDTHFPYHDLEAINTAIEYGLENDIEAFYLNGDILDCAKISRWGIDNKMMSFEEERDMFWGFIEYLKQFEKDIIFKAGNHEERIEAYLKSRTPELATLSDFSIAKILKLEEYGVSYVESRRKAIFNSLTVIHGHEFGESTFSPVNPARGLFLRAKSNVIAGHTHQTSEHHENNLARNSISCWSTGALCNLNPDYRPFAFTKWNLGFAILEKHDNNEFSVYNKRIKNNKII